MFVVKRKRESRPEKDLFRRVFFSLAALRHTLSPLNYERRSSFQVWLNGRSSERSALYIEFQIAFALLWMFTQSNLWLLLSYTNRMRSDQLLSLWMWNYLHSGVENMCKFCKVSTCSRTHCMQFRENSSRITTRVKCKFRMWQCKLLIFMKCSAWHSFRVWRRYEWENYWCHLAGW